jgi:hypothetical protein
MGFIGPKDGKTRMISMDILNRGGVEVTRRGDTLRASGW